MPLNLLSGGAAKGVVGALEPLFRDENGVAIAGEFGAVGAMRQRLLDGAPCDAVILTAALIDGLIADGLVVAGSAASLGRVATGIAVRDRDARPDVSDAASLALALRAAPEIYFPDPERATAGIHFVRVLKTLGVHDDVASRLRPFPNGATAMARLAADGAPSAIGCTQVTEILYTDGVTLVGALPQGLGLETVYTAAVASRAGDPGRARALVDLLTGPRSAAVRTAGGFDTSVDAS